MIKRKIPFDPALAVLIAADSLAQLRKIDVYRVLDYVPARNRQAMAVWINEGRPDLAAEVAECLADIAAETPDQLIDYK